MELHLNLLISIIIPTMLMKASICIDHPQHITTTLYQDSPKMFEVLRNSPKIVIP